MKITYEPTGINNFHNRSGLNLIISGEKAVSKMGTDEDCYKISMFQAKKIEKHFCTSSECGCPKGATIIIDIDQDCNATEYGISKAWCR